MKIYVKSIASQGINEYAWFRKEDDTLIPCGAPDEKLDEDLLFYYSGYKERSVLYCNIQDENRKDRWNRPITNKLYISAEGEERKLLERMASEWIYDYGSFTARFNSAFQNQGGVFNFHLNSFDHMESSLLPLAAQGISLPAFIDRAEMNTVFQAENREKGIAVRIYGALVLPEGLKGKHFICISQNHDKLRKEWEEQNKLSKKKKSRSVGLVILTGAAIACGTILYKIIKNRGN